MLIPVIAIDGPTASGKGTVALRVARALAYHYLDSGALYRLVALAAQQAGITLEAESEIADRAGSMAVGFHDGGVFLDGADVTSAIRAEAIGVAASRIAVFPAVRRALVAQQHAARKSPGLVADGRDMGTIIFPDAVLKVYLTASVEARATRRTKQLMEKGIFANIASLLHDLEERDARDAARSTAPLVAAPDAITIDSSDLDIDAVVNRILALVAQRIPGNR